MPKKGTKRSIGRSTPRAVSNKKARADESIEERTYRNEADRKRDAERRQNETSEVREQRNAYKRQRAEYTREHESSGQQDVRLRQQRDRQRMYDRRRLEQAIKDKKGLGCAKDIDFFQEDEFPVNLRKHELPSLFEAKVCPFCKAYRWKEERKGFCCQNGKVSLPEVKDFPQELKELYSPGSGPEHEEQRKLSKEFLTNIRSYNNSLALASIGCDEKMLPGFNPTFKIQGKVFHTIGSLKPQEGETPKFAQLYFYDTENEVNNRHGHNTHLKKDIIEKVQIALKRVNEYVKSLEYASTLSDEQPDIRIVIDAKRKPRGEHSRKYNLPLASEVSVLMPGEQGDDLDVVIKTKGGELQRISILHRSYDPLHYVLLFPNGDDGYTDNIMRTDKTKRVTGSEYYRYRLQVREGSDNYLMKSRRLLQQYATDEYAKIDNQRLCYIRTHQKEIRADKYRGLLDAVDENDAINAGQKVILPPSYTGGPRWRAEEFQDSMALVRKYGKPDIFLTFTTNPNWPEIKSSLFPGESPCDRTDICDRVFHIKNKELIQVDILKRQVFGEVLAFSSTIEFQKRGLPHSHTLLILSDAHKPRTPEDINRIVSAEIPDVIINPRLHSIVTRHMVHGPCGPVNPGSQCMESGSGGKVCSKDFPKEFKEGTSQNPNGYPLYRRRSPQDGGRTHNTTVKGQPFTIDNRWIVPFNPYLSLKYDAHLNVEIVSSVECVKYIYKYICKGSDRIVIQLANGEIKDITNDEVERWSNCQYIPASMALYRLYEFNISQIYPPVCKLPLHLEDEQLVYFQPEEATEIARRSPPVTKLTAYFELNRESSESQHILYPDIYKHYVWKDNKWVKRCRNLCKDKDGSAMSDTVGRIPVINLNANQIELYHLRMILYHKPGAKSFADLRTINGVEEPTFRAACLKLGLLDDDDENDRALQEAATIRFGPQLRETFAMILIWNRPIDTVAFWERHKNVLCEDLMRLDSVNEPNERILNEVLLNIEEIVQRNGYELDAFQLPKPNRDLLINQVPREIREETEYDIEAMKDIAERNIPLLNEEQREVYNTVMDSVNEGRGDIIALDAPGGSGKTFLTTTILAKLRSERKIGLGTAISGVAATLILNGRTLQYRCKVPVEGLHENSFCNVSKRSATAELIRRAVFLVIDEVTMARKEVYNAVDRTFQDIRENHSPFGGVTTGLPGDWRQVLPVIRNGGRADIIDACLKSSPLWKSVKVMKLTKNMRLKGNDEAAERFAEQLLEIGEGRVPIEEDLGEYKIKVDKDFLLKDESVKGLCNFVWNDLEDNFTDPEWLCSRAVLCPTNEAADEINEHMTKCFPGESRTYLSCDKLIEGSPNQFPEEFLNTLCPSGMPPHKLTLKDNCPIMLLRNLDPSKGHCNGTRYIVNGRYDHVIDATVATGVHVGRRIMIPRIPTCPTESLFPFRMQRRQFPVKGCFGMTANKAQGQGLSRIGIYLKKQFFSHGQLYVAMSRVGRKEDIKMLVKDGRFPGKEGVYIDNVVYPEILT